MQNRSQIRYDFRGSVRHVPSGSPHNAVAWAAIIITGGALVLFLWAIAR